MEKLISTVAKLEQQVRLLVQSNSALRAKSEMLKAENDRLKSVNIECELEIASLKSTNKMQLIAKSFAESEGGNAKKAKESIDKIMREIDDCIALVNK